MLKQCVPVVQSPSFIEHTSCFRTDRGHHQHGLESPTDLALLCEEETGFQNRPAGIAVPMTIAAQVGCHRDQSILDPRGYLSLCADMFYEVQHTPRLDTAPDPAQPQHRLTS